MAWITPKTDWKSTDFFNVTDYDRITGNINYLEDFMKTKYGQATVTTFPSINYATIPKPFHFNNIENALHKLNIASLNLDIGSKKTYSGGGYVINWSELNRIESACLRLYELKDDAIIMTERLPFTLGRKNEVK